MPRIIETEDEIKIIKGLENMNNLPQDPMMLLSVINTKLRDRYKDLESLCTDLEIEQEELVSKLEVIDFEYIRELNQFK